MVNQKCSSKQVITAYIYSIERNNRDFFFGGGGGVTVKSQNHWSLFVFQIYTWNYRRLGYISPTLGDLQDHWNHVLCALWMEVYTVTQKNWKLKFKQPLAKVKLLPSEANAWLMWVFCRKIHKCCITSEYTEWGFYVKLGQMSNKMRVGIMCHHTQCSSTQPYILYDDPVIICDR